MRHKFVKIKEILPKKSYTNKQLIVEETNNKLKVYYINKYPNNKLKTKKFQPKKAIIPKKIELTKELIECIGLYQGDGQKSINSKSYQAVRFSNSEPTIIKQFIKFLHIFGIKSKDLKIFIRIRTNKNIKSKEIINYWHNIIKIPKKNFYNPTQIPVKGKRYYRKGTLTIIYTNSSFRIVFDSLFNHIKKLALRNKEIARSFLTGLIAADGNVYFKKALREVNIAAKYNKDRIFIKKLLILLKVISNKDNLTEGKETVRITGHPNFNIIKEHGLCYIHPIKREIFQNLISSYKSICYRKNTCIPLIFNILKNKPQTIKELSIKLNRKQNAIRRYMNKLEKQNKVIRTQNKREFQTGRIKDVWNIRKP